MLWILLSAASACLIGAYEVVRKAAVGQGPALVVLVSVTSGGLLFLSPLALLSATRWFDLSTVGLALEPLSARQHVLVLLKSALVSTAWTLSYFSIKHLPISVAGPLRAISPVLTVTAALVLYGEQPSRLQWLGMAILFVGHFWFARVGLQEGITFIKDRWVLLLLLGTFVGSLSGVYDKHLLQHLRIPPTTLQFWFTVYNAALQVPLAWLTLKRERRTKNMRMSLRFVPAALLAGVLLVLADQFYMRAVAIDGALISVVSLTRRSSVLVSFTLGGILFRERLLKRKSPPLALVMLGLALLLL